MSASLVRRSAHLTAKEAQAQRLPALIEALESEVARKGCWHSAKSAPRRGRGASVRIRSVPLVAHVITDACVDIKDRACVLCCPVDCIYEGLRTLYIQPEEGINCGLCISVCPVDAIYDEPDVPAAQRHFIAINREFFGPGVTGLGAPGSADGKVSPLDHPLVAALPLRER